MDNHSLSFDHSVDFQARQAQECLKSPQPTCYLNRKAEVGYDIMNLFIYSNRNIKAANSLQKLK